jgi:hypothetical protein
MADATEQSYKRAGMMVPLLYVAGILAVVLGVAGVAIGKFDVGAGAMLLFGGIGVLALAHLFKLLTEIAGHLSAIRDQLEALNEVEGHLSAMKAQMNRGVLGLLG